MTDVDGFDVEKLWNMAMTCLNRDQLGMVVQESLEWLKAERETIKSRYNPNDPRLKGEYTHHLVGAQLKAAAAILVFGLLHGEHMFKDGVEIVRGEDHTIIKEPDDPIMGEN